LGDELSSAAAPLRQGYFMLHTRTADLHGQAVVRVLVENLGTGEKVMLATSEELSRYLDHWGGVPSSRDQPRSSE